VSVKLMIGHLNTLYERILYTLLNNMNRGRLVQKWFWKFWLMVKHWGGGEFLQSTSESYNKVSWSMAWLVLKLGFVSTSQRPGVRIVNEKHVTQHCWTSSLWATSRHV